MRNAHEVPRRQKNKPTSPHCIVAVTRSQPKDKDQVSKAADMERKSVGRIKIQFISPNLRSNDSNLMKATEKYVYIYIYYIGSKSLNINAFQNWDYAKKKKIQI